MNASGRPRRTLFLRRFEDEAVELSLPSGQRGEPPDPAGASCRIAAHAVGDAQIYRVELADGLVVLPVDWRRFAYDHDQVAKLLAQCVRDNLQPVSFEPWSEELKERIEASLVEALGDLTSVFDTRAVRCERSPDDRLLVTLEGEHKNGSLATCVVALADFAT